MLEKTTEGIFDKSYEPIDMGALVRLGSWGAAAVGALLLAVLAIQSENGARRLAGLSSYETNAAAQLAARRQELEIESKRLIESIRTLANDRDRLLARVTVLERNVEDVTGSVGRIGNAQQATQFSSLPPIQLPQGPSVITSISAPQTISAFPSPRAVTGPNASRSAPQAPDSVATATDFGVDIGGGPTIDSLRDLWAAAKGTHGGIFEGLRPVISIRDGKPGTTDLRLVVGPLSNASAAAKICASLAANGWTCRPAVFDGQRLALR